MALPVKNRFVIAAAILVAVFLVSFLPQYLRANRLDEQLRRARHESSMAELRDLAASAYVEASQKNYGLAAGTMARFYSRVPELANQESDPAGRKALEELLANRDQITAQLARGDAGVLNELVTLFSKTRRATAAASAP